MTLPPDVQADVLEKPVRHEWYGPEFYEPPRSHLSAAIQWPLYPDTERWASRVINGYLQDERVARRARRIFKDGAKDADWGWPRALAGEVR